VEAGCAFQFFAFAFPFPAVPTLPDSFSFRFRFEFQIPMTVEVVFAFRLIRLYQKHSAGKSASRFEVRNQWLCGNSISGESETDANCWARTCPVRGNR
ncbi:MULTISPECIES: hypothetical protein, partial [unclassified Streptomyces]|uniref:hypothetical protein n=1 Tax=unclassified Streptomyces TaxID=2593676 RepID=UPI00381FA15B